MRGNLNKSMNYSDLFFSMKNINKEQTEYHNLMSTLTHAYLFRT